MKKILLITTFALLIFLQNIYANLGIQTSFNDYDSEDKNIVIDINSSYALTVTADSVRVGGFVVSNVTGLDSIDIAITTTGVDGLEASDTSEVISKWYEVYLIVMADGTIGGLLNEYGTAIDMLPAGYVHKRKVGWVYNDSSGDFVQGKRYGIGGYQERGEISSHDKTSWDTSNWGTLKEWDLSEIVPPTTKTVIIKLYVEANTAGSHIIFQKKGNINTYTAVGITTQVAGVLIRDQIIVPCDSDQKVEYMASDTNYSQLGASIVGWFE